MKKFIISIIISTYAIGVSGAPVTLEPVIAEQDTYTSESSPDTRYGKRTELVTCNGSGERSDIYVKFYFAGITAYGTKVKSAKLMLYAITDTDDEIRAYYVPNGWGENALTWNNRAKHRIAPEATDKIEGTRKGQWVEFELAPYIDRNSYWNALIRTTGSTPVKFASKENGPDTAPRLVVTLNKEQPPVVADIDTLPPYEGPAAILPPATEAPYDLSKRPKGPIRGIYYNYTDLRRAGGIEFADHDLLDGVWISYSWKDIEPEKGKVSKARLNMIEDDIFRWIKASEDAGYPGRKALLSVVLQGLVTQDTPEWIYRSNGGPCDKLSVVLSQDGRPVTAYYAPVSWWGDNANADYLNEIEIMVKELAEKFDTCPYIAGIQVGIGHLGHITVSMNKYFAPKFLEKGWNPAAWLDFSERMMDMYLKYFKHKQLFIVVEDAVLRDDTPAEGYLPHYKNLRDSIVNAAHERGIGVLLSALRPDTGAYVKDGYPGIMEAYRPLVEKGIASVGIYDDWPLYDPYRLTQVPIDAEYFIQSMKNGTGPVPGYYDRTSATFMVTFSKEVMGSYKKKPDWKFYNEDIRKNVIETREKLLD